MKITILGIGFIGFQLMKDITKRMSYGDELFLVDRDKNNLKRAIDTLEKHDIHGIIHVLEGDTRGEDFNEYKDGTKFSWSSLLQDSIVYNLSAIVGVKTWNENAYNNYLHNLCVDNNIAEMIKQYSCKKYIYASSSEVLGSSPEILKEDSDYQTSNLPRGLYALEKIHGEALANILGVPYSVVRFFNIIGPYQDITKGVFPKFMKLLQNNEPIQASNDIRCFCDVRDASEALITLGLNKDSQIVNICNPGNTFTIHQLAQIMKDTLISSSELIPIKDGFIQKRVGDNSELNKYYKVKYNVYNTIKYFLEEQNGNR